MILTVFSENQRVPPMVLFKGKGRVGIDEKQQYAKNVSVVFTPKVVINGPSMEIWVKKFLEKVRQFNQLFDSRV